MFNSETLEAAIGMAFLFLLMSLICTGIQEWIEGIFKWRAMDLERALRTMLDDNEGQILQHLFAHPIVSSLFQGTYDSSKLVSDRVAGPVCGVKARRSMPLGARRNLPSYIPSEQFAKALLDLVARGPVQADGESVPNLPLSVDWLRERAAALDSPCLRRAILSAIDHSEGDMRQLLENLKHWFDGSMDRASGWYKRRTQAVLFILGLAAAVVLNVDALYVLERLTADKSFREAVVSAAAKADAQNPATPSRDPLETAREARKSLNDVGMPIGWRDTRVGWLGVTAVQMCRSEGLATPCSASGYPHLRMLLGWLVTAFAVMLGAPFWFDLLNKFMVIRSTVKPREKSPEEGSEDRTESAPKEGSPMRGPPAPPSSAPAYATGASTVPTISPVQAAPSAFEPHDWRPGTRPLGEIAL